MEVPCAMTKSLSQARLWLSIPEDFEKEPASISANGEPSVYLTNLRLSEKQQVMSYTSVELKHPNHSDWRPKA